MVLQFIDVLLLGICVYLLFSVIQLKGRVRGLNYMVNQLSSQTDTPDMPINHECRQLLRENKDVKAVKRVREALGLSLVEAKQYVDSLKLDVRS
ncbi:hypothetical protein [Salibacterium halotolerans]|uniref:Ribosomal protein L7/L12 C-terminal domain-containing protein n=1 Tax=Salibacterium halotolerans TaxID=1884432 RepID=A0A1I5Y740_9BACI|nr:Ribosomal protein L7/L12 C-terminal domain-containing protein [Salibacterium halotolerans]